MGFDWDEANRKHVARHGILPLEAEEAVLIDPMEIDIQLHGAEQRILCFGRTAQGRLLTVIYTARRGKIRVVTAYDMTRNQQRLYFEDKEHA